MRTQPFEELLWMLRFGPGAFSGEHSATPTHTQTCSLLSGVLQRNHDSQPRCSFGFYLTADHILFLHDADRGKTQIIFVFGAQENL